MPHYLARRPIRDNPLVQTLALISRGGPKISPRTSSALRRYGFEDHYEENCGQCALRISNTIAANPDPELLHALIELSYVEGKKAELAGENSIALNHYGIALTNSYDYLFDPTYQATRNRYDPQFRAVCDLYNESLEEALRLLCKDNQLRPGEQYRIKTKDRDFVVRTEMRGKWAPDEFDHYEFVSDFEIEQLRNKHTTYGLGVPLIAVRRPSNNVDKREAYYPEELSYAVTALMRCVPPAPDSGESREQCVLEFFDPLNANQIQLADHWVPLETDLTTPLAFFLDTPKFRERNAETAGLLNPADAQKDRGLFMLEPYDPDRIPVLMVHGLWSSPRTWMDMFNDLRSFPEIRERYQFWFYLYPSGQPFWISAQQLRGDLFAMRRAFDPGERHKPVDQMVLVGHSMGGLISRLQTIESGDDFWKIVSDQPVSKLKGDEQARTRLVSTLFFKPNRSVQRVITIGTPHRGSEFANRYTRWLARRLIKLPSMTTSAGEKLVRANPKLFRDTELLTTANAIDSLAPESPIFPVMHRAKYEQNVKFHNIIGVLEKPKFIQRGSRRGDGVVEYTSARMNDVESELVVDAEHTRIHMHSKAIYEVRRILLEHLKQYDSRARIATKPDFEEGELVPVRVE